MDGKNPQRSLFDRHGGPIYAPIESGRAAGSNATDKREQDTTAHAEQSCAVSAPIKHDRHGDVNCTTQRSTPRTMPGIRTSTTATRTTTTRTTRRVLAPSADSSHALFSKLTQAYIDCRRTKRNSRSALAFEINQEVELKQLHDELASGTYAPGKSICFVITHPKPREVWAAEFRDRIVHHLLYNEVGEQIERTFIADSCACIPNRGTLYAAKRLEKKVRSITQNWSKPASYLKCDIANFFVSINKDVLAQLLSKKITHPWWRKLAQTILFHDPRTNFELRGNKNLLPLVPPHKQLILQSNENGLPIGNLSSQFFANIYLNEVDQFVKHTLRTCHYLRYVDDMVILHEDAKQLSHCAKLIDEFLDKNLKLQLNPKKTVIQPVDRGIDFVGQICKPWRRISRRKNIKRAATQIRRSKKQEVVNIANSYFGLARQSSHSYNDRAKIAKAVFTHNKAVNSALTKTY